MKQKYESVRLLDIVGLFVDDFSPCYAMVIDDLVFFHQESPI
jgi:hypothetical protein